MPLNFPSYELARLGHHLLAVRHLSQESLAIREGLILVSNAETTYEAFVQTLFIDRLNFTSPDSKAGFEWVRG
jgi:hypothetical protein